MGSIPTRVVSGSSAPYTCPYRSPTMAVVGTTGFQPSPYTPGPKRSMVMVYVFFVTPSPALTTRSMVLPPLDASQQGLTLFHFSAQRKRLLWVRGCTWRVHLAGV